MEKRKRIIAFILVLVMLLTVSPDISGTATTALAASALKVTNVKNGKKILYQGSSFQLKTNAENISYKSSKKSVAAVTDGGIIYAKKKGKAVITVTDKNGNAKKVKVTVKKAVAYTISKAAGTYTSDIKVKLTAKKNYKIYYTTTKKFSKSKVVGGGKNKTFAVSKTTMLSLYIVKKTESKTVVSMNRTSAREPLSCYIQYQYTISKEAVSGENTDAEKDTSSSPSPADTATPDTANTQTDNPPEPPDGGFNGEGGNDNPGQTGNGDSGDEAAAQVIIDEELEAAAEMAAAYTPEEVTVKEPAVTDENTPKITLGSETPVFENNAEDSSEYEVSGSLRTLTIKKAGTYILTGGTIEEPVTNLEIIVKKGITEEVNLVWDTLIIDNSGLGSASAEEDVPVFCVNKETAAVNVTLVGKSVLKGNSSYSSAPASGIIYAKDSSTVLSFMASDDSASLTVTDSMPASMDFSENDPSDGIVAKGTLIMNSGTYHVTVNGDCLKATGADGEGGVTVNGGSYQLTSNKGNAIKSKNGNVIINGGLVCTEYTAGDGINAKNYSVIITGGDITIDNCYGDGIQGENVNISGDDTEITISTYYENAGKNYYNSSLGSGNYNILTSTNSTKKEVVNVDTGSHKGIKAGTKACSYSYSSVSEESDYEAGTAYSQKASGGLVISGGNIAVDTTNTGIKYNGSSSRGRADSSNLSAANEDQYIVGSPDDAIHSNNICVISGGTLNLSSADDGITAPDTLLLINNCNIMIETCYEGVEGGNIYIGKSTGETKAPNIIVYSNDDGVNAASKTNVTYAYVDESEEKYTKTQTSSTGNTFQILDGYLNIMIGDDEVHSFSLPVQGETNTTGTYSSDGDGIDCNGSFYAYGGTVIVYGSTTGDNSPIDTDDTYYIGSGVTLLAVGNSGMIENPTSTGQITLSTNNSSSFGSGGPGESGENMPGGSQGGFGGNSSSSGYAADTAFGIIDSRKNTVLAIQPSKTYSYILYSSPELASGTTYTFYSGGNVSGEKVADSVYDFRYTGYGTSGSTTVKTVTP